MSQFSPKQLRQAAYDAAIEERRNIGYRDSDYNWLDATAAPGILGLWIWGLVATIKYWKEIPPVARGFAIFFLVFNFRIAISPKHPALAFLVLSLSPIITLLIVYLSRTPKTSEY